MTGRDAAASLLGLDPVDRRRLADGLESGRLVPPYGSLAVRAVTGGQSCDAIVDALVALDGAGMTPHQIALWVATRTALPEDRVSLVASGPVVGGVTTRDTGAVVRELFGSAQQSVLVVGYAVHQGREVFRVLAERMRDLPALRVRMCLDVKRPPGDTSDASQIVGRFTHHFRSRQWPGERLPEVYYDPRALEAEGPHRASLHAKCVVVDRRRALVSSANFTEAALMRNIELGVLLEQESLAGGIVDHFDALIAAGHLLPLP